MIDFLSIDSCDTVERGLYQTIGAPMYHFASSKLTCRLTVQGSLHLSHKYFWCLLVKREHKTGDGVFAPVV